ncbi:MAG: DUF3617 family protein [Nitrospirae bacterium]|nr:MAG: DUF3617 family protein [Nitrospirota bacterium]
MMVRIFSAVVLLTLALSAPAFAEPNMKEGMWEMAMKMDMQGMPFAMPPMKFNQCITKKDMVPYKKEKGQDCDMVSTKISGDTVSWVVKCKDKHGTTESSGQITYEGEKFNGVINTTMTDAGGSSQKSKMNMSGRRIGACK